jgi:hypothetical protein
VGFVVDKMALEKVFSEYFGFPWQALYLLHIHHLASATGTVGQIVVGVPSGLSLTASEETVKVKGKVVPVLN